MPVERRMTEAELRRKTNKPIMEKKRRERINKCLEDLKSIVLTAVAEESRPNKLEKADILEMTVRYLKSLQQGKPIDAGILSLSRTSDYDDSDDDTKSSMTEYSQCDVTTMLNRSDVPLHFRTQFLGHLADKHNPVERKKPHHHPTQHYSAEFDRRSILIPGKPPHPYQIPLTPTLTFPPTPISPISSTSFIRRVPSPTSSDDDVTNHVTDCYSPPTPHTSSSDSGVWSSGSSPPSPIQGKSFNNQPNKPTTVWRPWGL
ncbi:transcription factor protein [Ciona intestinalis]